MRKMLLATCVLLLVSPVLVLAQDAPKPDAKIDVTGTWDMLVDTPQGQMALTAVFKQEGEKLTGTQASQMGEVTLEGTVIGTEIKYTIVIDMQGQQMAIVFGGKVDGDSMVGVFEFGGMGTANWSAKKRQ